jgi:hypothetical protein
VKTLLLSTFLLLSQFLFAQTETVKLAGKVVDQESGSALAGATIIVEGANKTIRTDVEGNFFVMVEKGKKIVLKISNVGYGVKVVNEVEVTPTSGLLTISMQKANTELAGVVVSATSARRESINSIYQAQKNSSSISDGISAEVIKRSPDRNTGEVLKRVSGASVQDNKFVVIRGLSERYNVAMLNNSILPSTEPDKKAFSFDIIPSSLVDNLVIYKSATPDLPGDFAGGAIKISTKDYPSKRISELSFSTSANTQTTFKNFYKGYGDGDLDNLGFFDNKNRLIPGPYYRRRGAAFFNTSNDFKRSVTKLFPNTFGYEAAAKSAPNFSFNYTGGNTALIGNNKLGYIYSIGYSEGRRVIERERSDYILGDNKRLLYLYNTQNYDVRNNLSGLLNLTYSYGKSKLSWKNLFNNDFTKTVGVRNGRNEDNQSAIIYYKSANTEAMNNGLFNSVLEGLHKLSSTWTVDWAGSYGFTYRNQPDQRILTLRTSENSPADYYLSVGYENSPEIRNAGRVYSYLFENIYSGGANLTKQFNWKDQVQKLKLGVYNYYRNRDVEVDALGYGVLPGGGSRDIRSAKSSDLTSYLTPQNIDQYNLTLANIPANSTDYNGQAISNAGYALLDNKFSNNVKLTWGARVERYWQNISAKSQADIERENVDVLPSFIFTYAVTPKTNLRLAGSQAVNRPEFRELADYRVYDYENNIIVVGNPSLVRSKVSNADLRYEWFPSAGEILSISGFYKNFDNPIEQVNKGNDVYSYANATKASAYGAELELRKKLNFAKSSFLNHLTVYANAAFIKGDVKFGDVSYNSPLQGQSPYLVNGGISYSNTNDDFSVNALYNKVGPRLRARAVAGGGKNQYEKPRDVLDVQLTKKFAHNRLEAKLTVSDILAQSFKWYEKYEPNPSTTSYNAQEDRVVNAYKYGTTTTLSLKYNFSK